MYGFDDAGTVGGSGAGARQLSRDPLNNGVLAISSNGVVGGSGFWLGHGTGATLFAAIAIQEAPPAPDFSISASPAALTIRRSQSGSSTVTVSSNDTFWNAVTFSQTSAPSGVGVTISPNPVTLRASSFASTTATFTVPSTYVGSGWTSTVTGCGGGVCHSSTIAVVVPVV
ncbi:MAG TPA: hypothetical protein VFA94_09865 [Acidimicrobiales bacterium]|nr:hypothetical protein [Acidimicrobiales bacterium]